MPCDYTPIATIDLSLDRTAVIEVFPTHRIEDGGWAPWSPTLVVQTIAGELRFTYAPDRKRFSVLGATVRYRGMPTGCTLQAHRDERNYHGSDADVVFDNSRTPKWNVCGSDSRSDGRAVTQAMHSGHDKHLDAVTGRCAKAGMFRRLIEVTLAWEARKRLAALEVEIARLAVEREELARSTASDGMPF